MREIILTEAQMRVVEAIFNAAVDEYDKDVSNLEAIAEENEVNQWDVSRWRDIVAWQSRLEEVCGIFGCSEIRDRVAVLRDRMKALIDGEVGVVRDQTE